MKARVLVLGSMVCLVLGVAAGRAGTTKTVQVDCTQGGGIAKALESKADELIIEISGICDEEVQVRRSNVTLRGSDPMVDGIRPAPDEPLDQALQLLDVHLVVIENLRLTGGRVGLGIQSSFLVDVINCRVDNNETVGVVSGTASGTVNLTDSVVTGNGRTGILVLNGSSLSCTRCTVEDNGANGVRLLVGSELVLSDSTIEGFRAIDVRGGSRVLDFSSSTINGLPWALRALGTASVELRGALIDGRLDLRQRSVVKLFSGGSHTNTTGSPSLLRSGSALVMSSGTALSGDLQLTELSQAVFPAGASISGSLSCDLGADAFCDDPIGSVGGASDCVRCLKP